MSAQNCLEIDQASYITFEAATRAFDLELKEGIQSIKTISTSIDSSFESKKLKFVASGSKEIFMGKLIAHKHLPNNKIELAIKEITEKGVLGEIFNLTLHLKYAEEWKNSPTVNSFSNNIGNALIVFQNITYIIKGVSKTLEFHLMPSAMTCWMKVKHYFSTFAEANSMQHVYTPLYEVEKLMAATSKQKMKCSLYAVIYHKNCKPKESKRGIAQGMFAVVDPSCYEEMAKQREYCVRVFTSSLDALPRIETGDIIRMHGGWAEIKSKDGIPDFRVYREHDIVIFPWNDEERPRCSTGRFTLTKDDIEQVRNLKTWSLERYRQPEKPPENTRFHQSLIERLEQHVVSNEEPNIQPVEVMDVQPLPEQQRVSNSQPSTEYSFSNIKIEPSVITEKNDIDLLPQLGKENSVEKKDNSTSSGECSTKKGMNDIPRDFSCQDPPTSRKLVLEDFERESKRLHLLIHPELKKDEDFDYGLMNRFKSKKSDSLKASPNAKRIPSPAEFKSPERANKRTFKNPPSPYATSRATFYRAVDKDLEIHENQLNTSIDVPLFRRPTNDLSELANENQLNTSIDVPLFRSRIGKEDEITSKTTKNTRVHLVVKRSRSDVDQEMCKESGKESVIILGSSSQQDMEEVFRGVEDAKIAQRYLQSLEDQHIVQPGERFRITSRIGGLLPKPHFSNGDDPVGLKNMLVAFCRNCKHLWRYSQFIDSVSNRVMQRRTLPPASTMKNDMSEFVVVNYLCSKEEHIQNIRLLIEGNPNIGNYEYDENVFMDKSYHYICPFCDSRKIPHSLCILIPSFFLRMHATEKSTTNGQPPACLHILATGVHAEYFLGTKADHVLRSREIWKRAEGRIIKLVESQRPFTLGLIRRVSDPNEVCLEYTKTVFASNHLLPWR